MMQVMCGVARRKGCCAEISLNPQYQAVARAPHSSSQTSTRFWPTKWLGIRFHPLTFLRLTTMR